MRIAYFGHVNGGHQSGVFQKIGMQIDRWRTDGHVVRGFIATRDRPDDWIDRLGDVEVASYDRPWSRLRAMIRLASGVRRLRPDLIYLRWDLFYPPMLSFLASPLVIEINTDDVHEYALGTPGRARYNTWTRGLLMRRAKAFVFVTSELSRSASFARFRGRRCVITNGIDLAAQPVLTAPHNEQPRLVFVGSAGQPWQGIDKVVTLARQRPQWSFDVVGSWDDGLGTPSNVTWHGPLGTEAVRSVLAQADVGIGTLALHRKSMSEACPLKVREYLAVGLPVLYGYMDPDADRLAPLTLRIANTESNVTDEIDRIDEFVEMSRGARVPRASIAHIDVAAKEAQRLALFHDVAIGPTA